MLKKIIAISSLFFLTACTTSTTVTTGFYDVKGKDAKSLDRSIRRNSPQNGHAFALTELRMVPVALETKTDERGCRISNAQLKVVANITLPRWSERGGAPSNLKRGFDNYTAYARAHERAHVKIGEAAARAIEAQLKEIPPQRDCARLQRKVHATTRRLVAVHVRAQLAFDASEKRRIDALLRAAKKR